MHNKKKGRERHARCLRRMPRGIASEAEDMKNIPNGVGEARDAEIYPLPVAGASSFTEAVGVRVVGCCNHKVQEEKRKHGGVTLK